MTTGGPANTNEPPRESLYWKLWDMGPSALNSMTHTPFYAEMQGSTYPTDTILIYNQNDFFHCSSLQGAVHRAMKVEAGAPSPSLQFALYYLNEELTTRMNEYVSVWKLQWGMWAPTMAMVHCARFLYETLTSDGVFYFMCAVLARQALWGIVPGAIDASNAQNTHWLQWKNTQELSYVIGNEMDLYSTDHPGSYDIHKALSLYGQALDYEVGLMQEIT